jgi:hypothetical protein
MTNSQHDPVPSFGATVLPPLVAFVVAGLVSPLYSNEPFGIGQTTWSAVVLWPIGLLLVGVPVLVLLAVRTKRLLRVGQLVIGLLGVLSMVSVARSDDAQAGVAFMYAPIGGSVLAVMLLGIDGRLRPSTA